MMWATALDGSPEGPPVIVRPVPNLLAVPGTQ